MRIGGTGALASHGIEPTPEVLVAGVRREVARSGIGFGTALAIAISWTQNQSILWAVIHGVFSWFYVIYYAIFK